MGLRILGVRHGEVHNPDGIIYAGLAGYGLSEVGRGQAAALAAALSRMNVIALYSSPLDRAMETAGAVADAVGLEIRSDVRLHEWRHWQQWAGMTWDDLQTKASAAWDAYRTDPGSVTSGESLAALADRVESWLADVRRDYEPRPDDDAVVVGVSHLEPLRAILLRMLGRPATGLFDIEIGLGRAVRLHPSPDAKAFDAGTLAAALLG